MALAFRSRRALVCAATLALLWQADGAAAQTIQLQSVSAAPTQTAPAQTAQTQPSPAQPSPAQPNAAQPMPQPKPPLRIVDEIKIGVMAHDIALGGHHRESGEDVNAEILFASPSIFRYILSPRPHFGVDANGSGNTTNYYAGLTWGGVFYRPGWSRGDGFFGYFSEGPSVNDGKIST